MGQTVSTKRINFEDMQHVIANNMCIITTLDKTNQECLILGTINITDEETIINNFLNSNLNTNIIVYGKNCNDDSVSKKCTQLIALGFKHVYAYSGGIFEWLLLQDIYGTDNFPINTACKTPPDIIKYKPIPIIATKNGQISSAIMTQN